GARVFNGTSSLLSRAFSSAVTNNFTFGAWACPDTATSAASRLVLNVGTGGIGYGIYASAAGAWGVVLSGVNGTEGGTVTANEWHFVVARRSGGATQLYVNGVAV